MGGRRHVRGTADRPRDRGRRPPGEREGHEGSRFLATIEKLLRELEAL